MKRAFRLRPSPGFVLLVASYALLVSFLAWGAQRPDLERGWYIIQQMQRDGFAGLAPSDSQVLEHLLQRHAQFAHALLGKNPIGFVEPTENGWLALQHSHLVVQAVPSVPLRVIVDCRAPQSAYPVSIVLETEGQQQRLEFATDTQQLIDLSGLAASHARWVNVTVAANQAVMSLHNPPAIRVRTEDGDLPRVTQWP